MRFLIDFQKENRAKTILALEAFLDEIAIGKYFGSTFECMDITFIELPKTNAKPIGRYLYHQYAEVKVPAFPIAKNKLDLDIFKRCYDLAVEAVKIAAKIPVKKMDFSCKELLKVLDSAKNRVPKNQKALEKYFSQIKEIRKKNHLKRVRCDFEARKNNPKPLTRLIKGIRIYDEFNNSALYPYANIIADILVSLLKKNGLKTPGYQEIYINLASTEEEAMKEIPLEDWFTYSYASLNLSKYEAASEYAKVNILLHSVAKALRILAAIDHLDKRIIENAIAKIKQTGINIVVPYYLDKENERYLIKILYHPANLDNADRVLFFLQLTDKSLHKTGVVKLGYIDTFFSSHSFGKISLNKKEIVIHAKTSFRARASLKIDKLPNTYRFNIEDILSSQLKLEDIKCNLQHQLQKRDRKNNNKNKS